jgi:hypothetical protein
MDNQNLLSLIANSSSDFTEQRTTYDNLIVRFAGYLNGLDFTH